MRLSLYFGIVAALLSGCWQQVSLTPVSSETKTAESVYLTHDHQNNPVLVWTEKDIDDLTLFFAISDDNGRSFSEKMSLPLSVDVATHPESMPKVAFKNDGTIIAAYEKKAPTNENKDA